MTKYLRWFNNHSDYEDYINGDDVYLPNVSWCNQQEDIHCTNVPFYWTLGYVTDGMVAMWDAIYNTGTNLHDSSATAWVDLVSGITSATFSNQTFADNYLNQYKNSLVLFSSGASVLLPTKPYTVEIVSQEITQSTANNAASGISLKNEHFGFFRHANNSIQGPISFRVSNLYCSMDSGLTYSQTYPKATKTFIRKNYTPTGTGNIKNAFDIYYNGVIKTTQKATMSYGSATSETDNMFIAAAGADGNGAYRYYCIRVYNRALTAAEIMKNYQVDLQRFV